MIHLVYSPLKCEIVLILTSDFKNNPLGRDYLYWRRVSCEMIIFFYIRKQRCLRFYVIGFLFYLYWFLTRFSLYVMKLKLMFTYLFCKNVIDILNSYPQQSVQQNYYSLRYYIYIRCIKG